VKKVAVKTATINPTAIVVVIAIAVKHKRAGIPALFYFYN